MEVELWLYLFMSLCETVFGIRQLLFLRESDFVGEV